MGCLVNCPDKEVLGFGKQLDLAHICKVQHVHLVKDALQTSLVAEIGPVVEFGELDEHIDNLGLIGSRKTSVLLAAVNAADALEYKFRRKRVLQLVSVELIKIAHAGHQRDHLRAVLRARSDRLRNALPNIGSVVPVQVHQVTGVLVLGTLCFGRDDVQVLLVGRATDDVDHVVELLIGKLLQVLLLMFFKESVVGDFLKVKQKLAVRVLVLAKVGVRVLLVHLRKEILLAGRPEVLRKRCLAHSRQTHRYKEKSADVAHLRGVYVLQDAVEQD